MKYLDNNHSKEIVKRIDNFVQWCQTQFGKDNFYIELQSSESDDQNIYNECALAYAKARGLKVIITTDAHYIKKEDRPLHKAYLNAGEGDRETDAFYSGTYLQSVEDIKGYMKNINSNDIDWMLDNTNEIANKIEEYSLYHKEIVPKIKLEKEFNCNPMIIDKSKENNTNIYLEYQDEYYNIFIKNKTVGFKKCVGMVEPPTRALAIINGKKVYKNNAVSIKNIRYFKGTPYLSNYLNIIVQAFFNDDMIFINNEDGEDIMTALSLCGLRK